MVKAGISVVHQRTYTSAMHLYSEITEYELVISLICRGRATVFYYHTSLFTPRALDSAP